MDAEKFLQALHTSGISLFAGVPDSYLHGLCSCLREKYPEWSNIVTANEGNAIGVACGHYLATGGIPLVYMQNSGLGNAVNPLASLTQPPMYSIPMVLLIGWRGQSGAGDHVQHEIQGRITLPMLELLSIPYQILDDNCDVYDISAWAVRNATERKGAVALIVPKGVLSGVKHAPIPNSNYPLTRKSAMECVLGCVSDDTLCVPTTGRAARELYWLRESLGLNHANDVLNVGSMGHASSIALGVAQSLPKRQVICFDGDAAALMHMGSLAIIGQSKCTNLLHVVLNNGQHESVGGQPSVAWEIDLTGIARSCGYACSESWVSDAQGISSAIKNLSNGNAPGFLEIRVSPGLEKGTPPLEIDSSEIRESFMLSACGASCGQK